MIPPRVQFLQMMMIFRYSVVSAVTELRRRISTSSVCVKMRHIREGDMIHPNDVRVLMRTRISRRNAFY